MIEKISWAGYTTALVIIVIIYYIVIILKYYRKEISLHAHSFQHRFTGNASSTTEALTSDTQTLSSTPVNDNKIAVFSGDASGNDDISIKVFDLVEKINQVILQYAEKKYIKEEILTGLQLFLKEYGHVKYTAYTSSINNIVIKECETHCSIRLEDDEVKRLWV